MDKFIGEIQKITIGCITYSNCGYIEPLYNKNNLISLTRDRKNRAIYAVFSGDQKKFGRKKMLWRKVEFNTRKHSIDC